MKETFYVCDICGKKIKNHLTTQFRYTVKSFGINNTNWKVKMDVCQCCFNKFREYVKAEQLKGAEHDKDIC